MAATSAFREPLYFLDGPLSILDAATRSSLIAEMQRAKTASAIVGAGTPMSRAVVDVHLPVPFSPSGSRTTSTKVLFVTGSLCLRISAVISIRKLSKVPFFHSAKIALISAGLMPSRSEERRVGKEGRYRW